MEPQKFIAGDTVAWTKTLTEHPASAGWVLTYFFINATAKYTLTAAADGDDYRVALTAEESQRYIPGTYAWQAAVSKAGERYTVDQGSITVEPGFASAARFDPRSPYRQALDHMRKALLDYQAAGQGMVLTTESPAGGTFTFRSSEEIQAHIEWLERQVAVEDSMNAALAGIASGRIATRF